MRMRSWAALVLIALLLLQVAVRSQIGELFAKPVLKGADYLVFAQESRSWILFAGLALFIAAVGFLGGTAASSVEPGVGSPSGRTWFSAFLILIGLSVLLVMYANPEGRFPWNQRESYITIVGRTMKPYLYERLPETPEMAVMGSSVSYTVPADQLGAAWDAQAFNMAINGGSPDDIFHLLNFMIHRGPDGRIPSVVTVELIRRNLHGRGGAQMPVNMVPYMDLRQGSVAVLDLVDHVLRFDSASDSLFTLLFIDQGHWSRHKTFSSDGTWLQGQPIPEKRYRKNLAEALSLQKRLLDCQQLDAIGVGYVENIVSLSEQYRFAVVFYFPPVSTDFYTMTNIKPQRFDRCRRLLDTYMEGIAAAHPNVFFRDLSDYPPISDQGRQAYLDTHHLNRDGSMLLMQALSPQIEAALEWARENR